MEKIYSKIALPPPPRTTLPVMQYLYVMYELLYRGTKMQLHLFTMAQYHPYIFNFIHQISLKHRQVVLCRQDDKLCSYNIP